MTRVLTGIFAGVIGATLLAVAPATAQNARVGYINVQRVLAEAPGTADAQQTFDREMQGFRAELEAMENELDTLQANFERQQATMTESMRQQQQSTMQQKFITYQQRQSDLEQTLQQRQSELLGPIMDRIITATEQVRAAGNFSMVFDAGSGGLVTADPSLDLSDQVLSRLRSMP